MSRNAWRRQFTGIVCWTVLVYGSTGVSQVPAVSSREGSPSGASSRATIQSIALPKDMPAIFSMDGRSGADLWLLASGTVYHYDGKATRRVVTPGCVSLVYPQSAEYGGMPYNVTETDAERESARARRSGSPNADEGRWIDFLEITASPDAVRVWGNGSQYYVRGGGIEVFSARIVGNHEICEGSKAEGSIEALHTSEQGNFFITSIYGKKSHVGPFGAPAGGEASAAFAGMDVRAGSGVWLWGESGNLTWHGNGWTWELRPVPRLSDVYFVHSLGPGKAVALGDTLTEVESQAGTGSKSSTVVTTLYEQERWSPPQPLDERLNSPTLGVASVPGGAFWFFASRGYFGYWDGGRLHIVEAPRFDVSRAHCGADSVCFVAGTRDEASLTRSVLYRVTWGKK